jgi:hypothetical protein
MTEPTVVVVVVLMMGGDDALLPLLLQRRGERTNRDGELVVFGREREALGK